MEERERLRARREALGLSQRELARLSGVKQPLISAIESGRREPTPSTRDALEEALATPPSRLLARHRRTVHELVHAHRGRDVYVFGSVARQTDTPSSDVDLLVHFDEGAGIMDLLALEEELSTLLGVRVDVVSAGSSGPVLERALAEAVPV